MLPGNQNWLPYCFAALNLPESHLLSVDIHLMCKTSQYPQQYESAKTKGSDENPYFCLCIIVQPIIKPIYLKVSALI